MLTPPNAVIAAAVIEASRRNRFTHRPEPRHAPIDAGLPDGRLEGAQRNLERLATLLRNAR